MTLGMDLHIALSGSRSLTWELYEQLRNAILEGRLRPGEGLPPTRELATRLEVSRNTVLRAYERLTTEGFTSGRVGAGTFVREDAQVPKPRRRAPTTIELRPRPIWESILLPPERTPHTPIYDFRVGTPDVQSFPYDEWRRLLARPMRRGGADAYGEPAGHPRLREAIARHIRISRSIQVDAEDILVTGGTQQALDLIGRVLIEPGMCVAMEDPGYPLARMSFHANGAQVAHVPVDEQGVQVDAIPDSARMVYVTPSHQFPLGMAMTLARRMALLRWAERRRTAVIEDDYDGEFRFGGRPVDPLHRLDRTGCVLYVGSFSKVLLPSLRLGYVVAPPSLRAALRTAKLVSDWHTPSVLQLALAQFMEEGLLARHVRKARREYETRRERLHDALHRHLRPWLEPMAPSVGLQMTASFCDEDIDARGVVRAARRSGIALHALSHFAVHPTSHQALVLGYGAIASGAIDQGIEALATVIRSLRPHAAARARARSTQVTEIVRSRSPQRRR